MRHLWKYILKSGHTTEPNVLIREVASSSFLITAYIIMIESYFMQLERKMRSLTLFLSAGFFSFTKSKKGTRILGKKKDLCA